MVEKNGPKVSKDNTISGLRAALNEMTGENRALRDLLGQQNVCEFGFFPRLLLVIALLVGLVNTGWIVYKLQQPETQPAVQSSLLCSNGGANCEYKLTPPVTSGATITEEPPLDPLVTPPITNNFSTTAPDAFNGIVEVDNRKECWMRIEVDGAKVAAGTLQPHERMYNVQHSIVVRDGCPGEVKLSLNGKPINLPNESAKPNDSEVFHLGTEPGTGVQEN